MLITNYVKMRAIYNLTVEITVINNLGYKLLGFLFYYNVLAIACFIRNSPKT